MYLSQHLSENLQYVASIVSITGDQVEVHCELISAEETAREIEAYRTERVNRLSKELSSPYHPRKNMRFSLKAERALIEKGDFLQLRSVPSKEEFLNDSANCKVIFRIERSQVDIEHKAESAFLVKLLRLPNRTEEIRAIVRNVDRDGGVIARCDAELLVANSK